MQITSVSHLNPHGELPGQPDHREVQVKALRRT
jgi:hypothetical protein